MMVYLIEAGGEILQALIHIPQPRRQAETSDADFWFYEMLFHCVAKLRKIPAKTARVNCLSAGIEETYIFRKLFSMQAVDRISPCGAPALIGDSGGSQCGKGDERGGIHHPADADSICKLLKPSVHEPI